MLVKICGITQERDAEVALQAGADWIGVNLVGGPRKLSWERAAQTIERVRRPEAVIALLLAEPTTAWHDELDALSEVGIGGVQCYGSEALQLASEVRSRNLVAIAVHHAVAGDAYSGWAGTAGAYAKAGVDYVLADAGAATQPGGTGRTLDWDRLAAAFAAAASPLPPLILAGGLTPLNVAEAIAAVAPNGVDVSSGVESAPGRKDAAKVQAFVAAARGA